jgi:hypothetical protein
MKEREAAIEKNILGELVDGVNVVITGAGHLTHLLAAIPDSVAPLRE